MPAYSELAPTTRRSAKKLSLRYGFNRHEDFAASLPLGSVALDVGAGKSNLGTKTAEKRPDIQWVDVDLRRGLTNYAARRQSKASGNYSRVQASVFDLPFPDGTFDRIFTCWLLPHVRLDSRDLAISATHEMMRVLTPEGIITASGGYEYRSLSFTKYEYDTDPDFVAKSIVDETRCPERSQKVINLLGLMTLEHKRP